MREYSVHIDAAELADMERVEVKTGSRGLHAPLHEGRLMRAVAEAFGCRRAYGIGDTGRYNTHAFIGPEHRVQIASYIAEVLLRKMNQARTAYIKSLYRVRKRYTKTCRADELCRGWVSAVTKKLNEAKLTPEDKKARDEYERSLGGVTVNAPAGRTSKNENDWGNGYVRGGKVEIQYGVGSFDGRPSLGAPS
jgi:hypothetical protein